MLKGVVGKIVFTAILLLCFFSCKQIKNNHDYGSHFVECNINILLDSLNMFDMRGVPRPEKFNDIIITKPIVQLKSIVSVDSQESQMNHKYLYFNLKKDVLSRLKSDYEVSLVKHRVDEGNIFVVISNFAINDSTITVDVEKSLGIGMTKDRYFFEKVKQKWIFVRKKNLRIG
jgi:hypothetical protein